VTAGTGTDANPRDGDRVTFAIEVELNIVAVSRTEPQGCEALARASRALAKIASGKRIDEIWEIDVQTLAATMDDLAEDDERCALTAIGALRAAVVDARVRGLIAR
jgi:NifU-like protein involved in Fe-S cluster formation